MKIRREWATPLTAGAFTIMAVTGLLMFFHLDRGLNHDAHEWLGWGMVLGVAAHVTANFSNLKKHLSGRLGLTIFSACLLILGLSFISPPEEEKGPGWAPPVVALARMPIAKLAIVAEMTEEEVRERLARIDPAGKTAESIQDLMGHNLRAQVRALNAIFPDEGD